MMAGPQPDLSLLDDVIKRTSVFPSPEPSFDPLTHPDELERFGLPPLPNQAETPEAYKFWHKLYSPPLVWIQGAQFGLVTDPGPRTAFERRTTTSTLSESSRNWSGLYITPRDGRMITQVYGSWNVPAINLPAAFANPNRVRSSTWIGLDGQRSYYHSSLPQIGTEEYLDNANGQPVPRTRAFWQWFSQAQPGQSQPLTLPVNATDEVLCALVLLSQTLVVFLMVNRTTNQIATPLWVIPPFGGVPLKVSGATAEWVMERSTDPATHLLQELPDYGSVNFVRCGAVSAFRPLQLGSFRSLFGARRVTMQHGASNPARTFPISRPLSIVPPNQQHAREFEVDYVT